MLARAGEIVLVQCKRWDKPIGVPVVRELLGAVTAEGATRGVLVASSKFTDPARTFARENDIELVDGAALRQMIGEVQRSTSPPAPPAPEPAAAPSIDGVAAGRANPSAAAAAVTAAPAASTACPLCGSSMTQRTARRGSRAGTVFLGCTTFPSCRGTRPLVGVATLPNCRGTGPVG